MMNRRFVHLLVSNAVGCRSGFTLHSIGTSSLFNPTSWTPSNRCAAEAGDTTTIEDANLPSPAMAFYRPSPGDQIGWMEFMPLGSRTSKFNDCIIGADHEGRTILYDATSRAVRTMPVLHAPKPFPVSLTIGDSLYVMNRNPHNPCCFEALIQGRPPDMIGPKNWYWHSLPPPPYLYEPPTSYEDNEDEDEDEVPYFISAYTVVGDSSLWYSAVGVGTYCFDTVSHVWSKVGGWALPFYDHAQYVAELGLWFGFSSDNGNKFCTSDLKTAATGKKTKPVLLKAWQDLIAPEEWIPTGSYLVPLGSGKFCIARFFALLSEQDERFVDNFGVFTGVEVVVDGAGALRMIQHKSIRYVLGHKAVKNVL